MTLRVGCLEIPQFWERLWGRKARADGLQNLFLMT
jgi:hypothetical protein